MRTQQVRVSPLSMARLFDLMGSVRSHDSNVSVFIAGRALSAYCFNDQMMAEQEYWDAVSRLKMHIWKRELAKRVWVDKWTSNQRSYASIMY